jgi:hypothetical protein
VQNGEFNPVGASQSVSARGRCEASTDLSSHRVAKFHIPDTAGRPQRAVAVAADEGDAVPTVMYTCRVAHADDIMKHRYIECEMVDA